MAKVILFDGGDGGGIRITSSGVEPILPWDPTLRHQLRALNGLIRAKQLIPEKESARLLEDVITRLLEAVLTQIEEAMVGKIDTDNGLIYQDTDGGFTCGSSSKPPIPFPWPVGSYRKVSSVYDRQP